MNAIENAAVGRTYKLLSLLSQIVQLSTAPIVLGVLVKPESACSVSLMLLDDDDSACLLPSAAAFFSDLCLGMLGHGFVLRFDLPGDTEFALHSPAIVEDSADLARAVTPLLAASHEPLLYPFSLWMVPRPVLYRATELIEAFKEHRHDGELFADIIRLGGMRLAAWRSTFDLTVGCDAREWGIDTIVRSARSLEGRLQWASETPVDVRSRHQLP